MSTTSDHVFDATPASNDTELKRVLGPGLLLLFIVGDILGAGVYAVTGTMAGIVGGIVWLPFLLAFVVAALTALSYLELVTQVPPGRRRRALHAQGLRHPLRDLPGRVRGGLLRHHQCLDVGERAGAEPLRWPGGQRLDRTCRPQGVITFIAMGFMVLLALINLRGVGESVKFNVVLTLVEMSCAGAS